MPAKRYWLMKTEPTVYSIDDLKKDGSTCWEGVRNFRARNILRDEMQKDDLVLFYHSVAKDKGVAGIARVSKAGYPDKYAFDKRSKYHDAKSSKDEPRWYTVDIRHERDLGRPVTLPEIREHPGLGDMVLVNRSRLSVQPVTADEWKIIVKLGGRAK